MDARPQLERVARRALLGCVAVIVVSTILGGGVGLAVAVALTATKEKP